jgi:hypothetical protein
MPALSWNMTAAAAGMLLKTRVARFAKNMMLVFLLRNSESLELLLRSSMPTRRKICGKRPDFRVYKMRAAAYLNFIAGLKAALP